MLEEKEVGATPTIMPEQIEETAPQQQEEPPVTPTEEPSQPDQKERMYSKDEVIEMMRKRVNRSHQAFFNRYKVKDLASLDEAFGKISSYEQQIADLGVRNEGLIKDNAYLKHNIEPSRYGDIEAYFKGKGLKIDSDTLEQELATHPEWVRKIVQQQEVPQTTIKTLSPERSHAVEETEDEKMKRIFGV